MLYSENIIIELSGLPGSGKSTISKELKKKLITKPISILSYYKKSRLKFLISIPLTPFVIIKFYKMFKVLFLSNFDNYNFTSSFKIKISVLAVLNIFIMEYLIALTFAKIKNKNVILDGGFIQWGLAICARTPPKIRKKIWTIYLSHLPKNLICFILDCNPKEALRRALNRKDGVPNVFLSRDRTSCDRKYILKQYVELSSFIQDLSVQDDSSYIYISSLEDIKNQTNTIINHLNKYFLSKKFLIG